MTIKLRQYQQDAVAAAHKAHADGVRRPAEVLATGAGKSIILAEVARTSRHGVGGGKRVVVLAHREELVQQNAQKVRDVAPDLRVGIVQAGANQVQAHVISASVQTLASPLRRAQLRDVGLVIVDEAHHAPAKSYVDVLSHFGCMSTASGTAYPGGTSMPCGTSAAVALGFTATMSRGDGKALGDIWQEIVYVKDTAELIAEGFLVRPVGVRVRVDDLQLGKVRKVAGDYSSKGLGDAIEDSMAPKKIVEALREHAHDRQTLLFAPLVHTAEVIRDELRTGGFTAELVHGGTPPEERRRLLQAYRDGSVQILCNAMVFTEGTDLPMTSCVVIARPTMNPGLFCLDAATEVLTDRGWLGMHDEIGDVRAAGYVIDDGSVRWADVTGHVERPMTDDESMYALSSPGMDIRVTDQHRMISRTRKGSWKVSTAAELAARSDGYLVPIAGVQDAPGVPLTDDELRFVGWVMTDGTINKSTRGVTIYQGEHQPWNADIVSMLQGCGLKYTVSRSEHATRFRRGSATMRYTVSYGAPRGTDKHLRGWGALEAYVDKALSPALEDMDARQLGVLLEAMHLGDGSKQVGQTWTRRSYHISTSNKTMADRLQSLCVRRGFKCNIASISYNQAPAWTLHIKATTERHVGGRTVTDRPRLTLDSNVPGERVWCLETDTGTLITRRNGKVAIMGNCQMVGRGLRLWPGKTDCVVLDVVGATNRHRLAAPVDLFGEEGYDRDPDEEQMAEAAQEFEDLEEQELIDHALGLDEPQYKDGKLVHEIVDLFEGSDAGWLRTYAGVWFLATATDYAAVLPRVEGGYGVVLLDRVRPGRSAWVMERVSELGYAMAHAEGAVEGRRGDAWGDGSKSRNYVLRRALGMGLPVSAETSTGEAKKMITVGLASARIDAALPPWVRR